MRFVCSEYCHYLRGRLTRKKEVDSADVTTELKRCLNSIQLTFIGVGAMVGAGIYVMIGMATKEMAGPGIIISFLLAGFSSWMTSMCFAEFGSRIPRTGNLYLYIYIVYGEFAGFLVAWSCIVGYIMTGAISCRTWSGYVDSMLNFRIRNFTIDTIGEWDIGGPIAEYPDFLAAFGQLLVTGIAATGAQCSSGVINVMAALNGSVLILLTIVGMIFGSLDNWKNVENGGFLPFGFQGVLHGTSACFYAFFGFECITIAAEEATDYAKTVPRALIGSIVIAALLYVGTASSFTLLVPYYDVNTLSPLTSAFDQRGPHWIKYLIAAGPVLGLSGMLLMNVFMYARLSFSLAQDGFMWRRCQTVNRCTRVPILPVAVSGAIMALCALILDLQSIFRMYVIFCTGSFAMICLGVLNLRYNPNNQFSVKGNASNNDHSNEGKSITDHLATPMSNFSINDDDTDNVLDGIVAPIDIQNNLTPNVDDRSELSDTNSNTGADQNLIRHIGSSSRVWTEIRSVILLPGINCYIFVLILCTVLLSVIVLYADVTSHAQWSAVAGTGILGVVIVACVICIFCHTEIVSRGKFKVPLSPMFPILAGIINLFFMVAGADVISVIGFTFFLVAGVLIYLVICAWDFHFGVTTRSSDAMITVLSDDRVPLVEGMSDDEL